MDYNRVQQPKLAGNIHDDGERELRYANTDTHGNIYTHTHTNCYTNCNPHSDSDRDTNVNSNTNSNTDCHSNTYIDTDPNADSDGYSCTNTDYSLSTIPDDRPYRGSQHAVQFHGTSKRH